MRVEELGTKAEEINNQKQVLEGDLKSTQEARNEAVRFKQEFVMQGVEIAMVAFQNAVDQVVVLIPALDLYLVQPLHEVRGEKIFKPRLGGGELQDTDII